MGWKSHLNPLTKQSKFLTYKTVFLVAQVTGKGRVYRPGDEILGRELGFRNKLPRCKYHGQDKGDDIYTELQSNP